VKYLYFLTDFNPKSLGSEKCNNVTKYEISPKKALQVRDNAFHADRRAYMRVLSVAFASGFNSAPKTDVREIPAL